MSKSYLVLNIIILQMQFKVRLSATYIEISMLHIHCKKNSLLSHFEEHHISVHSPVNMAGIFLDNVARLA